MKKHSAAGIKAHGFALSGMSVYYLSLIYCCATFVFLIVLIPLVHVFPILKESEWLVAVPSVATISILPLHIIICCFYTVILQPNMVVLKWFGMEIRRIPVSQFKTFCAVGNGREDVLCLSCYDIEEMALMQEKRLLRSSLNKHDVPFRKRRADWQDDFAREFLNYLRKKPFSQFRQRRVIMLDMHPSVQCAIRQMYPQLPYMNYTGVTSPHVSRYYDLKENKAVSFSSLGEYEVCMKPDGIHIRTKQEEISFIPAQEIKTVLRVDIFKGYDRFYPHHLPLLFITGMSEQELAAQISSRGYSGFYLNGSADQSLLAMTAATYLTLRWNQKRKDCCVMYHTEKNLNTLLTLYPHIQFNETAASWLNHSVGSQQ